MLLNNQQIIEKIKKEIKICIETNDNENTTQNLWNAAKAMQREVLYNTSLPQETRDR